MIDLNELLKHNGFVLNDVNIVYNTDISISGNLKLSMPNEIIDVPITVIVYEDKCDKNLWSNLMIPEISNIIQEDEFTRVTISYNANNVVGINFEKDCEPIQYSEWGFNK